MLPLLFSPLCDGTDHLAATACKSVPAEDSILRANFREAQ